MRSIGGHRRYFLNLPLTSVNWTPGRRPGSTPHQSAATRSAGGVLVAQLRGQPRLAHGGEAGVTGSGERPAVVHSRADQKPCWHFVIEPVNTAFRRMGLIFPLETAGDKPDRSANIINH